jgi:hypothetical protein
MGYTGSTGGTGSTGAQGPQGPTGPTGPQSDYRLKENVEFYAGGTELLRRIPTRRFNFIGDSKRVSGFFAHEVAEAGIPEVVRGEKDAVDADGKPIYQSLDYLGMLPTLWSVARDLDARLKKLEGK